MRRLAAPAVIALLAVTLWLIFDGGFANYDTLYALLWGHEIASGQAPQMDLPLAPTPHPLLTFVSVLLSPLGSSAETAVMVLAFIFMGWLGYLAYRVAEIPYGLLAGALALLLVLTREPVLSFGVRAYIDIPYLALLLAALVIELRKPRAGVPVLGLIALAGLLRPEAWLFAGAYWLYLTISDERNPADLLKLALLVIVSPLIWLISDWILTGEAFFSFSQTRESVGILGRITGITNLPGTLPRRLGEVVREPVLIGAILGAALSLAWLRDRTLKLIVIAVIAVLGFALLAAAGLPIITRYVLLPSVFLMVFAASAVFGWRQLEPLTYRRERKVWAAVGAIVAVLLVVFAPAQLDRISNLRSSILLQKEIRDDLHSLVKQQTFRASCGPLIVPNHRPIPLLAFWTDRKPDSIEDAQETVVRNGYFFAPANARVARNFIFDRRDPKPTDTAPPKNFELRATNRSWRLYVNC